jgi:hypothetical protein
MGVGPEHVDDCEAAMRRLKDINSNIIGFFGLQIIIRVFQFSGVDHLDDVINDMATATTKLTEHDLVGPSSACAGGQFGIDRTLRFYQSISSTFVLSGGDGPSSYIFLQHVYNQIFIHFQ